MRGRTKDRKKSCSRKAGRDRRSGRRDAGRVKQGRDEEDRARSERHCVGRSTPTTSDRRRLLLQTRRPSPAGGSGGTPSAAPRRDQIWSPGRVSDVPPENTGQSGQCIGLSRQVQSQDRKKRVTYVDELLLPGLEHLSPQMHLGRSRRVLAFLLELAELLRNFWKPEALANGTSSGWPAIYEIGLD